MNPSLLVIPYRFKASKLYSQLPESGAGDFTVVRNTTATRVNASGLISSVAANVPRIDYQGGGCGSLLVEPAATNLVLRSTWEGGGTNPTGWGLGVGTGTSSPVSSLLGIDSVAYSFVTTAQRQFFTQTVTILNSTNYTFSFYVESITQTITIGNLFSFFSGATSIVYVDPDGLVISDLNTNISKIGRYQVRMLSTATSTSIRLGSGVNTNATASFVLSRPQLEVGSVATSYIPTVASTQTRNADVISLTGASALIGQASGTIYAEINLSKLTGSRYIIAIVVNTTNYFAIRTNASNAFIFRYRNGGSETTIPSIPNVSNSSTGIFKLALAYQDGNYAAAVNGTVYPSTASGIFPSGTFETVDLSFTTPLNDRITTAALYPTRLDNATLAQLTTL